MRDAIQNNFVLLRTYMEIIKKNLFSFKNMYCIKLLTQRITRMKFIVVRLKYFMIHLTLNTLYIIHLFLIGWWI